MQNTDAYTDFWHLATEVDFRLDRCASEQAKLNLLAGGDTLEIQLRRLASKVHELRTGDKDGVLHMLAGQEARPGPVLNGAGRPSPPQAESSAARARRKVSLVAVVEVLIPAVGGLLMIREEAKTAPSKEVEEAARTVARVAVTKQVAVVTADDDEALRTGAGG